jgi:hypothetical protein
MLRHRLSEDPARPLRGLLKADEIFIGGRGDPTSRGRRTAHPAKSVVVAAVEKVMAPQNKNGKHGHAVKRQHGSLPATPASPCCRPQRVPSSALTSKTMRGRVPSPDATITYVQLKAGTMPGGANRVRRFPAAQPALA